MRDIALIQPNSPFLIDERVMPNIGLIRVATRLRYEGADVDLHDFSGRDPREIKQISNDYETFGFSATSPQMPYVMNLARIVKEANPSAKLVLGGAHASAMSSLRDKGVKDDNISDLEYFDTVFVGEGEGPDVVKVFEPGWQKSALVRNLDETLVPDRDFIDVGSYKYSLNGEDATTVQTQRGCPHKCAFCSGRDVEMYNKVRMHSPQRVLQELDELNEKYGFTSFMWYDDEINLNPKRLEELCGLLAERDYKHRGFVRSDAIVKTPESVKWMKNAGFVKLCSGVESGSDRMLRNIGKGVTKEMNTEARKLIGEQGIHYEAFTLLGHPGERLSDVMQTYMWLKQNAPDDFDINLISPFPGSKMYDDAVPSREMPGYQWDYKDAFFNKPRYASQDSFYKGHDAQSSSDIRTKYLNNEQLKRLRDSIDRDLK